MIFRLMALLVLAACMSISTYMRWQARRSSTVVPRHRERPLLIVGRLVVGLPLFGGALTYVSNPRWMEWASAGLPAWSRWLGVGIGLLTVPAVYWVLRTLGANVTETVLTKSDHRLVTTGPYAWVRHPLYATGSTLFLSIGLMAANWFILLWAVIALMGIRLSVIPVEERALVAKFGNQYRRYQRRTGMLLPSLRGRGGA